MLASRTFALLILAVAVMTAPAGAQRALADGVDVALARARCVACHGDLGEAASAPVLSRTVVARTSRALAERLQTHSKLNEEEARALAAHLAAGRAPARVEVNVPAGAIERGGDLWRQSGCIACHDPQGIAGLGSTTWFDSVEEFLGQHAARAVPSHEFGFAAEERQAIAAWLLREQMRGNAPVTKPGLHVECFELRITSAGLPELDGLVPTKVGNATTIDVAARTRNDHFALRFTGFIDVPADGEWRFWLGSDDSSWLWLDGEMVIRNEGIAPYRERNAKRRLTRGMHRIEIAFTEAEGGEQLDLEWAGPGVERSAIPGGSLSSSIVALDGPAPDAVADRALAARGAAVFAEHRCAACHAPDASSPPARRLGALDTSRECAIVPMSQATRIAVSNLAEPADTAARFERLLRVESCTACHAYGDAKGMRTEARELAIETEDLGDEGRLPPDLNHAARQLRPEWIQKVVRGESRARPYLRIRMPHFGGDTAEAISALVTAMAPGAAEFPPATEESAMRGRALAGTATGGYACIACHRVGGFASLGPQGMDLAHQSERLRPDWMRAWLLDPTSKRPGTRMPAFFGDRSATSMARIEDLATWLSLGRAMPLPDGIKRNDAGWRLAVTDRPRLHTAFLKGVSARGLAVATPIRVNWAYDLTTARLAWAWRGEFLDVAGTWEGRAGRLLEPLGDDHLNLLRDGDLRLSTASGGDSPARVRGWRVDAEGHPILEIQIGDCRFEDAPRPRIGAGGSALVRTLTVLEGRLRIRPPSTSPDALRIEPSSEMTLERGRSAEFTYRW